MKIIVIGATGRVGKQLVKKLAADKSDQILAGARKPENIEKGANIKPFKIDLHDTKDAILNELPEADALIFAAGSGGKDLLQVDLNGAVKVMIEAAKRGIERFVMLSSRDSLTPDSFSGDDPSPLANYLIAKHFADLWLIKNTTLDYTILQPTSLTETAGTGKVSLGEYTNNENSIENVADVLAAIVKSDNTIGKILPMSDGATPIADAVSEA
ncbi:NAD(P)H-binding protein [Lentilactobacillus farraginis]|uniref:Flavin reductase n=1 Tax=Lentilactobacillus farraginis DSM 18382 = JCM 14108 TaxID=1423743 RepID=X0PBE7_9LACO|nr:NAD(P)H-binding protein [Lentilactobacillus farraginis]KRM05908.1 flavin reductase [Lentilactobacillus farraginis DSM 18382 = JCM 14108]GAF37379.1 predicted nucleoside-diphosphate-sugar epimerase [Lentilactobacillus farraginis DSM 18382 = JCM 14108]